MPARKSHKLPYLPHTRCDYIGRPRHPYLQVLHQPEFDSRNLIEAATTVIEAISNPFDVMQGNSFGGHVPACKCHKLSNAITNQARQQKAKTEQSKLLRQTTSWLGEIERSGFYLSIDVDYIVSNAGLKQDNSLIKILSNKLPYSYRIMTILVFYGMFIYVL